MAIKTTRWHFDHCPCVLDFTWDNEVSLELQTQTWAATQVVGPEHRAFSGPALYAVVTEENTRKNLVLGLAQDQLPAILAENYRYSFDASRHLTVSFAGIVVSNGIKGLVQSAADIQFGPGLVNIT